MIDRMLDREVLAVEVAGSNPTQQVVRITTRRADGRTSVRQLHPAPLLCAQHAARRLAQHHALTPAGASRWERVEPTVDLRTTDVQPAGLAG
jgi:hypothetical protein